MLVITMLLMAAPPVADRVQVKRTNAVVRGVRVKRKARRVRKPISLSVLKPRTPGCAGDPVCVTAKAQSRYRLTLPQTLEPTDKDMALAEDGTRCALIGQTICPRRTRTIIHVGEAAPGVPATALVR
ncbi:hypothetical protein NDN01_01790 [Sphingomonas sp. QA11]|uniref:hypothetical protein n=1 Tax=Sphingomonas sp. QA11 TaxID=2950605 RepID=UPI00234B920D|nr:hypothetical protein [Sphingomonas sp. QA11]WCM27690.1 hypothetical protein NDN01_01790 [Sphingomonas sp. QA11]